MDAHSLTVLEFERLLDDLARMALSGPGAEFCRSLRPDLSEGQAQRAWRLVDEARRLLDTQGAPPLSDLPEVGPVLGQLQVAGTVLEPLDLLLVGRAVYASRATRQFLQAAAEEAPGLFDLARPLPVLGEIETAIKQSLGPGGEVLDSASPTLGRIRREMISLRTGIQGHLRSVMRSNEMRHVLMDDIVTIRNGRYVVPVRASAVSELPGLVHDVSSSGASIFVEPLEVVQDNNRLNRLRGEEKVEVARILARLSSMVAAEADRIDAAVDLLAEIDSYFARAALSRRDRSRTPFLSREGLDLRGARHPLLLTRAKISGRSVTPIDVKLDPKARVLVISGVNAGGKTATLKTAGLLCLMAQAGLHIPVEEGSSLSFFTDVLADIGDEQDLLSDLSTFSGHVRRLSQILAMAGDRTLVLLDELGTGTDPADGAALAMALLDGLKDNGAWVLTATHLQRIKAYAGETNGVVNAAVGLDGSGRPTYRLEYGRPGFSAGLDMARSLGLDPALVQKAEAYLDEEERRLRALAQELEQERDRLRAEQERMGRLEKDLAEAVAETRRAEARFHQKRENTVHRLQREGAQAIDRAEAEFRVILKGLRRRERFGGREITAFHEAKARLRADLPRPAKPQGPLENPSVGDKVRLNSLGAIGTVLRCDTEQNRVEVDVDGRLVRTEVADLARPQDGPGKKGGSSSIAYSPFSFSAPPRELNLIGLSVDEALPQVDKLIDQALVRGFTRLSVIHGKGTGRLREAIRSFVKADARVRDFYSESQQQGGDGVTVIELAE